MSKILLQSNDNEICEVDRDVVRLITMFQDLNLDAPESSETLTHPIPLTDVNAATLKKIVQWCQYHKDDPVNPLRDLWDSLDREKRTDDIPSWDMKFMRAASYLDVRGLYDVICKTVVHMIKGKSPEEIRRTYGIENDMTQDEEKQIRKDNACCSD